jgi:hypothetical protein
MDVFNAGLGDDMIIINASNIAALEKTGTGNRARVDGGGGMDALKLEGPLSSFADSPLITKPL